MRFHTLILVLLTSLISACAQGPESRESLAVQGLFAASFDSNGEHAIIASQLHGASYWSLNPLERKFNWNHSPDEFTQITSATISGDGKYAATATENQWLVWDTETGKPSGFWQTPSRIFAIALNHDGSQALLGLESGEAWLTKTRTGNNVYELKHKAAIRSVAFSPNSALALTGSDDYSAAFWSLENGEQLKLIQLENMSRHVAFSESGKLALISSLRKDHLIINTQDFSVKSKVQERYTIFNSASFTNNDESLYLANQQGYIQVFNTDSGDEIQRFKAKPKNLFGSARSVLALSATDAGLLALSSDGQLQRFSSVSK